MIHIDKNVPQPVPYHRSSIYPLEHMLIGDSFYVDVYRHKATSVACSVQGKKLGRTFTVRKWGDGYRVWRVE